MNADPNPTCCPYAYTPSTVSPRTGGRVVGGRLLDELHAQLRVKLREAIKAVESVTFTADGWSSNDMASLYLMAAIVQGKLQVIDMKDLSDEYHDHKFLAGASPTRVDVTHMHARPTCAWARACGSTAHAH